jgi:acyl-coenzyme A thioesterase PaaI-like protein
VEEAEDLLTWGRQVLASQPFSVLVGARLNAFGHGAAEIEISIRDGLKQQHGFVHGGVISYVADNALTFAGGTALGPGVVTAEFKIR